MCLHIPVVIRNHVHVFIIYDSAVPSSLASKIALKYEIWGEILVVIKEFSIPVVIHNHIYVFIIYDSVKKREEERRRGGEETKRMLEGFIFSPVNAYA